MTEPSLRFIDRLQDRGLIDRWGFSFFALGGSLLILAVKWAALPTELVALGAVGVMFAYAIIVNLKGTGKLRSDQAGDNCYYLGLIFTLTSLSYAIFTFDPAKTATTIVQGFGIALATTIVGLILRVFFNQSRVDLVEVEDTARLELAEAAGKLKHELSQLALEFKDFTHGLQQSVAEVRDEASAGVQKATEQSAAAINSLASDVLEGLKAQSTELGIATADLSKRAAIAARSIEKHSASVDAMSTAHAAIASNLSKLSGATAEMAQHGGTLVEQNAALRELQAGTRGVVDKIDDAASNLADGINASFANISRFEGEFAARLKDLENGPKQVSDHALTAIAKAAEAVSHAMHQLASGQNEAIGKLAGTTDELLGTMRAHNDVFETELERSRANAGKVHDAFVDLTARLNATVE